MKTTHTAFVLTSAFLLGVIATSLISGCQRPAPPGVAKAPATTTQSRAPAPTAAEEPAPAEELMPADEPASDPEPADEPTPAEKPADEPTSEPAPEPAPEADSDPAPAPPVAIVGPKDWNQWGGGPGRNNTPEATNVPIDWDVGGFDRKTDEWDKEAARNIKWVSKLGSQTYGNPVVANGKVYCGTNNKGGWLKRYPGQIDLGCLICFSEADGSFLWQDSSEKLPTGRVHDWPLQGICCAPLVEGDRVWFVTSRGEVKCLDAEGYHDGEDDGPVMAGLARIVDVMRSDDPETDAVTGITASLNEGKASDGLREKLAGRGVELPAEVTVATETEGKKWTLTANIGDADRTFTIQIVGPKLSVFKQITTADTEESDVVWVFNMMSELGVSQHNMCSCSVTALGDILFVNTSNGLDESHINLPAPEAPSFIAMDKNTGEVLWTDKSPGANILHGQWSSPAVGTLGGVPQAIFCGGDGWVYSFKADAGEDGKPELLWKFDANPKESKWILGGRGTRNNLIATPVIYDGLVYVAVGQDPEHGEGVGHLWCLDPTKRGDVSTQLAMKVEGDERTPIEHRRLQAVIEEQGEVAVDNENSAAVWHYSQFDQNGDGEIDFEEEMHRSCGTVAIKDDLLYIADFSGLFHCLDAKSGKVHWTYDMLAAAWGSPLIVGGHVYIGDEDGDVCVFELDADNKEPVAEINMESSVYSTPIVANDVLYISTKNRLFAIATEPEAAE